MFRSNKMVSQKNANGVQGDLSVDESFQNPIIVKQGRDGAGKIGSIWKEIGVEMFGEV